ncbi:hypothetical protein DPMN_149042 [Dreissena polymorpha]|uniref:C2H2-type domain-containing protein n=1 Tax=Dreissena polymorpha TaxID=45954 RepID=A0A9D4J4Y3_DREPO|nr:hypothetical protein DPMN_149042 [Dreissena polymorpha]
MKFYFCLLQKLTLQATPCDDREMMPNDDPESLSSLDSFCGGPDMFTSNGSFYSKDERQFWCDTCGHGLTDLVSLTQHVAAHIVVCVVVSFVERVKATVPTSLDIYRFTRESGLTVAAFVERVLATVPTSLDI